MGHRLSKIYTRAGDDGTTGLADGSRVGKADARMEAIGAVDEANCALGITLAGSLPAEIAACLTRVQHQLFDLGGELALPGQTMISAGEVEWLESQLDAFNAELPPLREFILPGGSPAAALCHQARAMCRRAERRVVQLAADQAVNPETLRYLNRLSDLLFVVARNLVRAEGGAEVLWEHASLEKPE